MSFEGDAERIRLCAERLTLAARSDPAAAAELVEEIEAIAKSNPHPTFEAYRQRARGHLHQVHGNLKEAVQHYRRAFVLFEQSNEEIEKARTASTLVGALVPLGEFEESLRLAKEARRIFQEANLQNRAARLDVNVGNLYHRLNQLDDALLHYERAAAVLENSTDREAVAVVLLNRSVVLMLLYRFDDALNGFLRARAFSEEHDLKVFAAQSEYNRGYLLFLIGNYSEALKIMQAAERAFRDLGDEIHVAHCCSDRAEILLALNLPEHAIELATMAEKGFRTSGVTVERSRALLLLGRCLLRMGQTAQANALYAKARDLFSVDGNSLWSSMAELGMTSALMASGRFRDAADLAVRALEFFRSQNHVPFSVIAGTLAARLFIKLHDTDRALRILSECEDALKSQLPASVRYDIQYLKGCALEEQGTPGEARQCFESAIQSLEFLLTHISVDHAMVRFLEDKEDVYEHLAGLTEGVHQAFELVDRARTLALSNFSSGREPQRAPTERARQLRETLRSDYLRLFQSGRMQPMVSFQHIQRAERQLMHELLESEFRLAEPSSRISSAVEWNWSSDEAVLEYFVRDQSVSVFVISAGRIERITLPIQTEALREEVDFTRYGLSSASNPRRESALLFHLRRLYEVLIAPVLPLLRRRLVIVPHRFLHDLPFHALLGPDGYLAERYVVSYAPSAAAYISASRTEPDSSGRSIIIGREGPDLPAIHDEVRAVADELPNCRIAVNQTLAEVQPALESASFIHVASHAVFRGDDPAWSLLSLGSDVLAAADLNGVRVNASLVTMSACSTGKRSSRSNEVPGFVRAFSLWGVPSLIASLWEVNDEATSLLMTSFYRAIPDSPDLAENLRRAMLHVKERFAHPSFWSGFVLIGKTRLGASWAWFNRRTEQILEHTASRSVKRAN